MHTLPLKARLSFDRKLTPVLHKKFYKSASRASIAGSKRVLRNVSRSHRWCDRIIADTTAVTARRALSVSRDSFPQWAAKREVFATVGLMPLRVPTTGGGGAIPLSLGKTVAPRPIDIRVTATLSWFLVRVAPAVVAQAGQAVAGADRSAGVVLRVADWAAPRIPI